MLRYEYIGNCIITIDLHNGYTIIAISKWNREKNNYTVTLMLKENTVDDWQLIDKAVNVEFNNSDMKSISYDITKYVNELLNNGFFNYYIDRYDYMLKCFDRGDDLFEAERIG